jgi:hypothetical protein
MRSSLAVAERDPMTKPKTEGDARPGSDLDDLSIDRPRLTPQGRTSPEPSGEDATDPQGGAAKPGQPDKAEG